MKKLFKELRVVIVYLVDAVHLNLALKFLVGNGLAETRSLLYTI